MVFNKCKFNQKLISVGIHDAKIHSWNQLLDEIEDRKKFEFSKTTVSKYHNKYLAKYSVCHLFNIIILTLVGRLEKK